MLLVRFLISRARSARDFTKIEEESDLLVVSFFENPRYSQGRVIIAIKLIQNGFPCRFYFVF